MLDGEAQLEEVEDLAHVFQRAQRALAPFEDLDQLVADVLEVVAGGAAVDGLLQVADDLLVSSLSSQTP